MNKSFVFILIILILCTFTGCSKQKVKADIHKADNITIFYGLSSYATSISDINKIKTLSDYFNNLTFDPIKKKIDFSSMLSINFFTGRKCIAKFSVDKIMFFA